MTTAKCSRWTVLLYRQLSTSRSRYVRFPYSASASVVREIGRFQPTSVSPYEPGQMFVHRTFAYKGVIVCAFNCRFHDKKEGSTEKLVSNRDYYQVLVHRPDWPHMMFPVDLTCYLGDGTNRGEKSLSIINGMDCASHDDIIPFETSEKSPIDHDLFDRIFVRDDPDGHYVMRNSLRENYMASQKSWLAPRDVYREITDNIEVTVINFYLGSNVVNGSLRHMWRYVIRIENQVPHRPVILRERILKVYSLNNMNTSNGHGVIGKQPEFTVATPAFQFSSTIELSHSKGGHMWGQFKMERENGSTFNVTIPTITLQSQDDAAIVIEKVSE